MSAEMGRNDFVKFEERGFDFGAFCQIVSGQQNLLIERIWNQ
jgi:hypothetical protein